MANNLENISDRKIFFLSPEELQPIVHYVHIPQKTPLKTSQWSLRTFCDYQLIFLSFCTGYALIEFPDLSQKQELHPGECLLIPPGIANRQHFFLGAEQCFSCIHFLTDPTGYGRLEPWRPEQRPANPGLYGELFTRLFDAYSVPLRYNREIAEGICRELLLRFFQMSPMPQSKLNRADQMADYLRSHYLEHFGRAELARHFHLAPEYINQIFHARHGFSPREFTRKLLIREACRLFFSKNLSIKEISERLNFPNQFYFSRVFKQETGLSPRIFFEQTFRKKASKQQPSFQSPLQ